MADPGAPAEGARSGSEAASREEATQEQVAAPAAAEEPRPAAANEPPPPDAVEPPAAPAPGESRAELRLELQVFERQFRAAHGKELRVRHDLWKNAEGAVPDPKVHEYWRDRYGT